MVTVNDHTAINKYFYIYLDEREDSCKWESIVSNGKTHITLLNIFNAQHSIEVFRI